MLCQVQGQFLPAQVRIRVHAVPSPLEFTHVGWDGPGDRLDHILGDVPAGFLSFTAQNGKAGFIIGRLHVHGQPPLEARAQAFLQGGHCLGRTVGGDHDLLVLPMQGVESMEEFFLGGVFASDELNIIDQEHVHLAIFFAEGRGGFVADGVDQVVGKFL